MPEDDSSSDRLTGLGRFILVGMRSGGGGAAILLAIPIVVVFCVFSSLRWIAALLVAHQLKLLLYFLIGFTVITTAIVLYRLRCTVRLLYGLLELVFGVLVSLAAGEALLTQPKIEELFSLTIILPLVGGIYVCIRGLNNIEDGLLPKKTMVRTTGLQHVWWATFHRPLIMNAESIQPPGVFDVVKYFVVAAFAVAFMALVTFA